MLEFPDIPKYPESVRIMSHIYQNINVKNKACTYKSTSQTTMTQQQTSQLL